MFNLNTGSTQQIMASLQFGRSHSTYIEIDFCEDGDDGTCVDNRDTNLSLAQALTLTIEFRAIENSTPQTITVAAIASDFLALRTRETRVFTVAQNDPGISAVTLASVLSDTTGIPPLSAKIENAVSSALFTQTPSAVYANGNVVVSFGTAVSMGSYSMTATLVSGARTRLLPFTINVVGVPTLTLTRDGETISAGGTVYGTGLRDGTVYGSGLGVTAPISITLGSNPLANVNLQLSLSSTQSINVFLNAMAITDGSAVATVFNLATGSSSQLSASLAIDSSTNTYVVIDFCVMTSNSCLNSRDTNLSVAQQLSLEIAYRLADIASTRTITVTPIAPALLAVRTQNEMQEFTVTRNDPNVSAVTLANILTDAGLPSINAAIRNATSTSLFTQLPSATYDANRNVVVSFGTAVDLGAYVATVTLSGGGRTRPFAFTISVEPGSSVTLTRDGQRIGADATLYNTGIREGAIYGSGFGIREVMTLTLTKPVLNNENVELSIGASGEAVGVKLSGVGLGAPRPRRCLI